MEKTTVAGRIVALVVVVVVVAIVPLQGEALGSPARRLARRGVMVVPAPGPVLVGPRGRVLAAPMMVVPIPGAKPVVPVRPPVAARVAPPATVRSQLAVPPLASTVVVPPLLSPGREPSGPVLSEPVPATPSDEPVLMIPATPAPPASAPRLMPPSAAPAGPEEIPAPAPIGLGSPANAAAVAARAEDSTAFTRAWYAGHPAAWRPPQPVDVWATTDAAGLSAWLERSVRPAAGPVAGGVATAAAEAPDGTRSVLVLPAGHDEPAGDGWLPLGVFAVAADAGAPSHSLQQLSVDRDANIRGTFYDPISDTVQPISGTIHHATRTASWTVGTAGSRFEASLEALTNPPQTVAITSGGGTTRGWKLLRVAKP